MKKQFRWPTSIYEVYIPSFKDSDGDGKGDLGGVIEKLDFIKDQEYKAIKLSPFWESPWHDGGYDISNHLEIQPEFGDKETLSTLIREAHEREIKVMCDFVPNHTSTEHPWFKEAKKSRDNKYRDYFVWKDPSGYDADGKPLPPNNWVSEFDGGSAWTYHPETGQYYYHNFSTHQPDLNFRNPKVLEEQKNVLRKLLDMGFDGVRVDAVKYFDKDPEFRDEPPNPQYIPGFDNPYLQHLHIYTSNRPGIFDVIREFADVVRSYPDDKFMVSESYTESDTEKKKYYDLCGNDRHTLYNFDLIKIPMLAWKAKITSFLKAIKPGDTPAFNLGNHDRERLATRVGGEAQARVAALIQLTLPGTPILYNGDEIGMVQEKNIPQEKIRDVLGKNVLGHGRDGTRTPMQWTNAPYAGFSTAEPFQHMGSDYHTRNVEAQKQDPQSMLHLYKNLLKMRNEDRLLQEGSYEPIETQQEVFAYKRKHEGKEVVILNNLSSEPQALSLDYPEAKLLLKTSLDQQGTILDLTNFTLAPNEGYLFSI